MYSFRVKQSQGFDGLRDTPLPNFSWILTKNQGPRSGKSYIIAKQLKT